MSIIKQVEDRLSSTTNRVLIVTGTLGFAVIGNLVTPRIELGLSELFVSVCWLLVMCALIYSYESEVRSARRECSILVTSLHDATKTASQAANLFSDALAAPPVRGPLDHGQAATQMFLPVRDGAVYSGKWFGRHVSVSPINKTRVFSDHEYTLESDGTRITGELVDHLVGKKYRLSGGFIKSGILWQLEDESDPHSFGLELYTSPLDGKEMKGFLLAFDYHSGKAFLTPIILSRTGFVDRERFVSSVRSLLERVRVDDKATLSKEIYEDPTKR